MECQQQQESEAKVIPDALMSVGKDEMNLVETPLSEICRRRRDGTKTLVIEREATDRHTGQVVTRTTTITGADQFGLLKPCDDIVTIGLISRTMQFAQERGEMCRKVPFSTHGLCRELGWSPTGRNYKKLEDSLDRLSGVRIKTKEAWYDNGEKEWKSLNFGIIDNYELCSKGRYDRRRPKGQLEFPMCNFVWNEIPFKSFCDNYVKSIDMKLFRAINRSAVALRLYRFTDKRFFYDNEFDICLAKLARAHLALSRNYAPSQMKREIDRGYERLIEEGYLVDVNGERYFRGDDGQERVRFIRQQKIRSRALAREANSQGREGLGAPASTANGVQGLLQSFGVSPKVVRALVQKHAGDFIQRKIECHEYLLAKKYFDKEDSNPAGHLAASISEEWQDPPGFVSKAQREEKAKAKAERERQKAIKQEQERRAGEERVRQREESLEKFIKFRGGFSEAEQIELEAEAMKKCDKVTRDLVRAACRRGEIGPSHQMLWEKHIMPSLSDGST